MCRWAHWAVSLCILFCSTRATALSEYAFFPSDIPWVTKSSEHFDVLYREGQTSLANRALSAAERAYQLLTPIFPKGPERTWLVLADFQDVPNGYSLNLPYSHIVIFVSSPDAESELASYDDWLLSIILHEYVHTLHLYPARGLWKAARTLFGSWVIPNALMPRHCHEGLAVLLETKFTRGGRGSSPHYAKYRRMAVKEGVWGTPSFLSLDRMDGGASLWPYGESPYYFGYYFYQDLWKRKGAQGIYQLTESAASNWPFFINTPVKEVYGESAQEIWEKIFESQKVQTLAEIEKIEKESLPELTYLTESRSQKQDLTVSPDGKNIAFRNGDQEEGTNLEIWNIQAQKREASIGIGSLNGSGMCWGSTEQGEQILYIEADGANGYSINKVQQISYPSQKGRRLDSPLLEHTRLISCEKNLSKILVYTETGGVGIVREMGLAWKDSDTSLTELRTWTVPSGQWAVSLLAGDVPLIALRDGATTSLYEWKQGAEPNLALRLIGRFWNLKPGRGSHEIFVLGDFTEREEIFAIDLEKYEIKRVVGLLGGANSFDSHQSEILLSSYQQGGYRLASTSKLTSVPTEPPLIFPQLPNRPTFVTWQRADVPPAQTTEEISYRPTRTLWPRLWLPNLLFVPDGWQAGAFVPGIDITQRHAYELFGGLDKRSTGTKGFADFTYTYRFGSASNIQYNAYLIPSYLTSSKTFVDRYGTSLGWGRRFGKLNLSLSARYRRSERAHLTTVSFPATTSVGLGVGAKVSFGIKKGPGAISTERGLSLFGDYAYYRKEVGSTDNYFSTTVGLDHYLANPIFKHHVLYIGARAGYTEGTNLINQFFEGGGELVFHQNRTTFLSRGYLAGQFAGRRMASLNVEYRLPLLEIERGFGLSPLFLKRIHAALIFDALTYDLGHHIGADAGLVVRDNEFGKVFFNSVGIEIKSDIIFSYYLPAQIKFGFYRGFKNIRSVRGQPLYFTFGLLSRL